MPELAEVETVCRVMRRTLVGKRVERVEIAADPLVFSRHSREALEAALLGRVVDAIGRRGKTFWISFRGGGPTVYGHLGMSGWIRELGVEGTRLHSHGEAPLDDATGRPRFVKLLIQVRGQRAIAFTDPRRLGRIWLGESPATDPRVAKLGPDALDALPTPRELLELFGRRHIPIKAVLLDQSTLAGLGNWLVDEVLYQARIAPKRIAASLDASEVATLRRVILSVLRHAVKVEADHRRFPKSWLFEHRWGGTRGSTEIGGHRIVREEVGGRTTAWVPTLQK